MERPSPITVRIVEAVAEREGIDPVELEPSLHNVVDTEALERLFRTPGSTTDGVAGWVRFDYRGYQVEVDSTGCVHVEERAPGTESPEPVPNGTESRERAGDGAAPE